jgi:hypothetical protein
LGRRAIKKKFGISDNRGKVVSVAYLAPRHETVWGKVSIAPRILNALGGGK